MRSAVLRAGRGLRWYLRQATGEAKWDEYVALCREQGAPYSSGHTRHCD